MTVSKLKKFTYFIGIDVSRDKLDYAVMQGKNLLFHRESKNEKADIVTFIQELKMQPGFTITKSVFVMEHTGFYCNHLLACLKQLKANIVVENALQIKNSLGLVRGKYDKIDAIRIAHFAYINREHLRIHNEKRAAVVQLANLFSLRNRLLNVQSGLSTSLREQKSFVKKKIASESSKSYKHTLMAIKSDMAALENGIDTLLKSDEGLKRLYQIITSVPHIGRITAIQIIISTNEFRDIHNPKKFACYAGVAPFKTESGKYKGIAKVSKIANKKVKSLLHICAISCIQKNKEMTSYFERKLGEGKSKMAIINAIRYKLILRIFACVNQNRVFEKDYTNKHILQQA